jgi:hypothetical protein
MKADLAPMRMEQRDAADTIQYNGSAIIRTQRSIGLPQGGFQPFEEQLEEFRKRFDDDFLRR